MMLHTMEKRVYKRIPVSLEAELITDDIRYVAFVGNLSENGINTIITPLKATTDFSPGTDLLLKFQLPSGEAVLLNCKKRWSYAISTQGLTKKMGMEIINPPEKYREFLHSLQ
jgi:hypothetical protein